MEEELRLLVVKLNRPVVAVLRRYEVLVLQLRQVVHNNLGLALGHIQIHHLLFLVFTVPQRASEASLPQLVVQVCMSRIDSERCVEAVDGVQPVLRLHVHLALQHHGVDVVGPARQGHPEVLDSQRQVAQLAVALASADVRMEHGARRLQQLDARVEILHRHFVLAHELVDFSSALGIVAGLRLQFHGLAERLHRLGISA
mmetsp:Transcript_32261/g.62039  ORF Transcript_32261/g.62039 Transcript_32261/m.62039 type:complete len:200 (+) Transcript_32261:2046-2645(+)